MNRTTAESGMLRLESLSSDFDYSRAREYAAFVKDYLRRVEAYLSSQELSLSNPIVDTTANVDSDMPEVLTERFDAWASQQRWLSPMAREACRYYVKYLCLNDQLTDEERAVADIYEPLIELLSEGGDFYVEHGSICLRDAASIPFVV